jgi:chaperone required for assembly of F1-ATPase
MKKFYTAVSIGPSVSGGFVVMLDGRPIRTPEKALMIAATPQLAMSIAGEWQAQSDTIIPDTMPLTQFLTTCIDRAIPQRAAITNAALAYLDSDLLCYHADAPEALRLEQTQRWTPWLKWFEKRFGIPLETTYALNRLDQPEAAHQKTAAYIHQLNTHTFTIFQAVTNMTGSIVLGLAFTEKAITGVEAWRCTLCEELFYERTLDLEKHGLDPVEQKRRDALLLDLEAAEKYLKLIYTISY